MRYDLRLREREPGRARSHCDRRRYLGQSDRKETGDCTADAARERFHLTHRAVEATPRTERAQAFSQLEWRATRYLAQFQILSSAYEQDCLHVGRRSSVPA